MTLPNFGQILHALDRFTRHEQVVLSALAVVIGGIGGGSAIAFREGLGAVQLLFYGFSSERVVTFIADVAWWHILAATTIGGLAVGLIVEFLMPGKRPLGVADVMEASALKGGRMSLTGGIRAALVSAVSLGAGASTGREGPVVHLGATRQRLGRETAAARPGAVADAAGLRCGGGGGGLVQRAHRRCVFRAGSRGRALFDDRLHRHRDFLGDRHHRQPHLVR